MNEVAVGNSSLADQGVHPGTNWKVVFKPILNHDRKERP